MVILCVCHFYRAMLCMRGTSHEPVSVCLTSRSSTKTAKRRITKTAHVRACVCVCVCVCLTIPDDAMNSPLTTGDMMKTDESPEFTAVEYELPKYPIQMTQERQKQERRVSQYVSVLTVCNTS